MTESDDKTKNLKGIIIERKPDEELWRLVQRQAKGTEADQAQAMETIIVRVRDLPEDADRVLLEMSKTGSLTLKRHMATLLAAKPSIPWSLWSKLIQNLSSESDEQVQMAIAPSLQPYKKLAESINLYQERILGAIPKGLLADIARQQAMLAKTIPSMVEMSRLAEGLSRLAMPLSDIQKSIEVFREIKLPPIQFPTAALDSIFAFSRYQDSIYSNITRMFPSYYHPEETVQSPKGGEHALLTKLKELRPGRETWSEYQKLCDEILRFCLVPPLLEPTYEEHNESGIHRRDMIYYIPHDGNGFWEYVRNAYGALAVIVDAKNYSETLPKDQIVIASKYFGKKKLGSFGIIVTRLELDGSGKAQQADRWVHHDEMIVCLADADLEEMIRLKLARHDPERVIDRKIREFRSSL